MVDVSESVPDAAIEDARAEITKGLQQKPADALVRVITFAKRPRVVPLADDAKEAPPLERHDVPATAGTQKRTGLGAATDLASAMQLAYGQFPRRVLAACRHPHRRRADRRRHPRRGQSRQGFRG